MTHRIAGILLFSVVAWGCGSTATPPEQLGSVTVMVATEGEDLDADGYTVLVGTAETAVASSGTAVVDGLSPGSYEVTLGGIAANCSVPGGPTRSVRVTERAGGSVSFAVECLFDAVGIRLEEATCPGLAPPTLEAVPMDVVPFGSAPADFDRPLLARMSSPDGSGFVLGLVLEEAGALDIMIPLHPGGSVDGGDVVVRISDETQTCPPFTFRVLPLPAAPNELAEVVDVAQSLIDARALLFGTNRAALLGTPISEMEPALVSLAIAQTVLDDGGDASSLRAYANGTAEDYEAGDAELLDRILARTGLRSDMEAALAHTVSGGSPYARGAATGGSGAPARAWSPEIAIRCVTALEMDAMLLDECMELARDKAQGPASQATQDRATLAMDVSAMLGSRRIAGRVSALIGWSKIYDQALADNLPSSFVSLTLAPDPADFREDQPGPGSWRPAMALATSNGWNLEALLTQLIIGRIGVDIRPTRRLSWVERRMIRRVSDPGSFWEVTQLENLYQGLLEKLIEALTARGLALTDSVLAVPPLEYGPTDVSDAEWSDVRIVSGSSIELTDHGAYEPREPGTSLLEVVTAIGKFGGTSIATDHVPITVGEVRVTIEPAEVLLRPGQDTTFTVTVTDALHPDSVALIDGYPVLGVAELVRGATNTHTVTYTAPSDPEPNSTDLVAVHHAAEGGARGLSSEARAASATVRFGGIRLLPVLECVAPGQEVQVDAAITGLDPNAELIWTASAGEITATGLFTAPAQTGPVEITVTLASDPSIGDTLTVVVGDCVCGFTVEVTGSPAYTAMPGDSVVYISFDGTIAAVSFFSTNGWSTSVTLDIPSVQASGPGDWPLNDIRGYLGFGADDTYYGSSPAEGDNVGTLRILEYEPHTSFLGEVVGGTVREDADQANPALDFSATFRVYPRDGALGWYYGCVVPEPSGF